MSIDQYFPQGSSQIGGLDLLSNPKRLKKSGSTQIPIDVVFRQKDIQKKTSEKPKAQATRLDVFKLYMEEKLQQYHGKLDDTQRHDKHLIILDILYQLYHREHIYADHSQPDSSQSVTIDHDYYMSLWEEFCKNQPGEEIVL